MSNENLNQTENIGNQFSNEENPLLATAVTNFDLKTFKATTRGSKPTAYIFLSLAILLFVEGIVLIFLKKYLLSVILFLLGLILGVLAIVIFVINSETIKYFKKGIVERYAFHKKYILQSTLINGEFVGEMKIFYHNIVNKRYITLSQNEGYLILNHHYQFSEFIVHLQNMPIAEMEQLEKLLNIKLFKKR